MSSAAGLHPKARARSSLGASGLSRISPTPRSMKRTTARAATDKWSAESSVGSHLDGASAFVDWARACLVPLRTDGSDAGEPELDPLGEMIGDASVVAFGEGVHCGAEPLLFRNRLLQYLVRHKSFTAIAIESGIVESRVIHDYVRGGAGDLSAVVDNGIGWTFHQLPQNRELVSWLRQYNDDSRNPRKVNFYGFDLPGSPANPQAVRGTDTALTETLGFLRSVDSEMAAELHARLRPLENRLHLRFLSSEAPGYEQLSQVERDALSGVVADLVALIERNEAKYTAASSAHVYRWGYRTAVAARQLDNWLRQLPRNWEPVRDAENLSREAIDHISAACNARDRAQADNLDWIIDTEGPRGKVLVFAHRVHLSTTPAHWLPSGGERRQEVAGTYLKRRLGERLVTIANLVGSGEVRCGDYHHKLDRTAAGSIDAVASTVGTPQFLLDIRTAPKPAADWLNKVHRLAHSRYAYEVNIGRAFDLLLYLDTVTPACRAATP
jgi:erythromycin esterase